MDIVAAPDTESGLALSVLCAEVLFRHGFSGLPAAPVLTWQCMRCNPNPILIKTSQRNGGRTEPIFLRAHD